MRRWTAWAAVIFVAALGAFSRAHVRRTGPQQAPAADDFDGDVTGVLQCRGAGTTLSVQAVRGAAFALQYAAWPAAPDGEAVVFGAGRVEAEFWPRGNRTAHQRLVYTALTSYAGGSGSSGTGWLEDPRGRRQALRCDWFGQSRG